MNQIYRLSHPRGVLLLLCLWTLGVFTCQDPAPDATLSGTWSLLRFQQPGSDWVSEPPPHLDVPVQLACTDNGRRGHFTATTATNRFNGTYSLTAQGDLTVTHFQATYLGESQWGIYAREAFPLVHGYAFEGNALILRYGPEGREMVFAPEP